MQPARTSHSSSSRGRLTGPRRSTGTSTGTRPGQRSIPWMAG
jgi:hypothetical protein